MSTGANPQGQILKTQMREKKRVDPDRTNHPNINIAHFAICSIFKNIKKTNY
jgi:hypothetical protein